MCADVIPHTGQLKYEINFSTLSHQITLTYEYFRPISKKARKNIGEKNK